MTKYGDEKFSMIDPLDGYDYEEEMRKINGHVDDNNIQFSMIDPRKEEEEIYASNWNWMAMI